MRCFHLFLFLLVVAEAFGQIPERSGRFINYGVESGLSSKNVNVVTEGPNGFMWIGTEEGLNRFDGRNFVSFLTEDGKGAIPGNNVQDMLWLKNGTLLLGFHQEGLSIFYPNTNTFVQLDTLRDAVNEPFISVTNLHFETDSTILVGYIGGPNYRGGLARLNLHTMRQEALYPEEISFIHDVITEGQTIWCVGRELFKLETSSDSLSVFTQPLDEGERRAWLYHLVRRENELLVSAWGNGLYGFDTNTETWTFRFEYDPDELGLLSKNAQRKCIPKNDDEYWLVTADQGLGVLNLADTTYSFFKHSETDPFSIVRISARDVMQDSRGIVWVSMASGLCVLNQDLFQISYHAPEVTTAYDERQFQFNQAVLVGDDLVVAANYSNGFYVFKKDLSTFKKIIGQAGKVEGIEKSLSGVPLVASSEGRIWSMCRDNVYQVDVESGTASELLNLKKQGYSGLESSINTVWCNRQDQLCFGTDDNLVGKMNVQTGELDIREIDPAADGRNLVYELGEDGNGNLWIGSEYGLYVWDEQGIHDFKEFSKDYATISHITLESIAVSDNYLFCGTKNKGLYVFNLETLEMKHFGRNEGMPNLRVAELEIDQNNVAWGITGNGLVSCDPNAFDPIFSYDRLDGLKYTDMVHDEVSLLADGRIVLGCHRGVGSFNPDELKQQPKPSGLVISRCVVQGEDFSSSNITELHTNHGESVDLYFQAIGYVKPEKYRYAWRLQGDEEWKTLKEARVLFPNLVKDIVVEIKAANESGEWSDNILALPVYVYTPFWLTSWFKVLVGLLVVVAVLLFFRFRLQQVRKNQDLKLAYNQKIAEVEMSALRAQMNPHFLFNCLNSIKYFIINNETDQASDYLTKFGRLIRLILSNSKSESISLKNEIEALKLYVELESLRFDQKFQFKLEVDEDLQTDFIEVPPMIIQPFVENAIWHGLMHLKESGWLRVRLIKEDEDLLCEIEDNGVGRTKAANLKSKSVSKEKSMGMDITRNRLMRIQTDIRIEEQLEIIDLVAENGSPRGTLVRFRIPLKYM